MPWLRYHLCRCPLLPPELHAFYTLGGDLLSSVWHFPQIHSANECRDCSAKISEIESCLKTIYAQMGQLRNEHLTLQSQITQMQRQIDDLQRKPPVHVEYHFDQLKVSRLEGTLNIGLTPNAQGEFDQFDVPAPGTWQTPPAGQDGPEPFIPQLLRHAGEYFDKEALSELTSAASEKNIALQAEEIRRVAEDVKSQLGPRIQFYARTTKMPADLTENAVAQWELDIIGKVKLDVRTAFENYLTKRKPQSTP